MIVKKDYTELFVLFIVFLLTSVAIYSIHYESEDEEPGEEDTPEEIIDFTTILPDWRDGQYHNYAATTKKIQDFNKNYPDLVEYFSIGKSVQDRDIWCIKITNEENHQNKYSCVIDGCIHGNEWEAGEACLYLAEYLLINSESNSSIKQILNNSEIYIIPLLNPDGREDNTRWNDNGIDLNRNFDVHFGRLRSRNIPIGKLFRIIKIPYIRLPLRGIVYTNSGRRPFSEPETTAIRDFMKSLDKYSFYLNCHTAQHSFGAPGVITYRPEFTVPDDERKIMNAAIDWVNDNTEYSGSPGEDFKYTGIGCATDWVYYEHGVPSFCFEILNDDYEPWVSEGKHDQLVHWMKTTLPVYMYLLVNIENFYNWNNPDIEPLLPNGIPPEPLK